jgi:hypothetical protein
MTSFIAAGGSGRSTTFIPAVPAAWSVTTTAFMGIVSSVIYVGEPAAFVDDFICAVTKDCLFHFRLARSLLRHASGGHGTSNLECQGDSRVSALARTLRSHARLQESDWDL